jgi:peptidoglycan/LPS O-acetylase OafA/YrhL
LVTPSLLGSYLTPGSFAHFGQPSVLSYRLNAFLAGMLVAVWLRHSRAAGSATKLGLWLMLAAGFCLVPLSKPVILLYLLFVALVLQKLAPLAWLLSLRPFKVLGDISYSIYLSHLLVLIPTIFWLSQSLWFMDLGPAQRFWIALALTCPLVILLAYILHATIETGGMRLGRKCTQYPWFAQKITR